MTKRAMMTSYLKFYFSIGEQRDRSAYEYLLLGVDALLIVAIVAREPAWVILTGLAVALGYQAAVARAVYRQWRGQ